MTPSTTTPAPFTPDEAWIDAFKEQCTDELRLIVKRFAARRARGVGKAGGHVDDDYARDLVQDAIADTLFGVLSWDHVHKTLRQHLEDAIFSRTRHDRQRAVKFRHERIDALGDKHPAHGDMEASLKAKQAPGGMDELMFAEEVLAKLRELAAKDPEALRFIDAIVDGARSRADIMHFGKMTLKAYRNTRSRLRRMVDRLDPQMSSALRRA